MHTTERSRSRAPAASAAVLAVAALVLALAGTASAQDVPSVVPYQGFLTDAQGNPVNDTVDITFALYTNEGDAMAVWSETQTNIPVENGVFYVYLGMNNDVVPWFDGTNRYLGIDINGDGEATPRQEVGSVPYALRAGDAAKLGGVAAEDYLTEAEVVALIEQYTKPYILGVSNHVDDGHWEFGGSEGTAAANEACRVTYPNEAGAHMCMPDEVRQAVHSGRYAAGGAFDGVPTWTIGERMEQDQIGFLDSSLGNTCQDLLFNAGDVARGTQVAVDVDYASTGNSAGNVGDVVIFTKSQSCSEQRPVLCCR